MSLTIRQAVLVTSYFSPDLGLLPKDQLKKKLSREQILLCNQAFNMVASAKQKDFDVPPKAEVAEITTLVDEIKPALEKALPDEMPPVESVFKKSWNWVAHRVHAIVFGIANFFGRVSTKDLYVKIDNYQQTVRNLTGKLGGYYEETKDPNNVEQPIKARYVDIDEKIRQAREEFHAREEEAQKLENLSSLLKKIVKKADDEIEMRKRDEKQLSDETLKRAGLFKRDISSLTDIVFKALKDLNIQDINLEDKDKKIGPKDEIFGKLWNLVCKIRGDNEALRVAAIKDFDATHAPMFEARKNAEKEYNRILELEDIDNHFMQLLSKNSKKNAQRKKDLDSEFTNETNGKSKEEIKRIEEEYHNKLYELAEEKSEYEKEVIKERSEAITQAHIDKKDELEVFNQKYLKDVQPLVDAYQKERRVVEEYFEKTLIPKIAGDEKKVSKEIRIARDKLQELYKALVIEKKGPLAVAKNNLEELVEKEKRLQAKEQLWKLQYPALVPIGEKVKLDLEPPSLHEQFVSIFGILSLDLTKIKVKVDDPSDADSSDDDHDLNKKDGDKELDS